MAVTYSSYLKIDELLSLQSPLTEGEHDETLFIVIHQVYELWFKQILHELDFLEAKFAAGDTALIGATFKRMLTIMKTMVGQIDILETMTPLNFLSFRERLETSSGFQSLQFRTLEFKLGKRSTAALEHLDKGSAERTALEAVMKRPALYDTFLSFLKTKGFDIPASALKRNLSEAVGENPEVQAALLKVYRTDPLLAQICERLVDLDEGIQEWRYRHVKMVERVIGMRMGTGGSSGAEYLRRTLFQPLFPDLWAIRVQF
jgi:tryptophan 2,3-dioxygenase